MKTDFFQSYGHCWVFQICWHIECRTFIVSSFRIWNSSTGIPSPLLALFIVMLPTYLTSHSRISGSRWVITPSWLSGLLRSFLYSSSVYPCLLFLISSSVRSKPQKGLQTVSHQQIHFIVQGAIIAESQCPVGVQWWGSFLEEVLRKLRLCKEVQDREETAEFQVREQHTQSLNRRESMGF